MSQATEAPARHVCRATHELVTVLLLTLGSLLFPVLGWLVGAVMLWTSKRWRLGEKLLGTLVWPGGFLPVVYLAMMPARTCVTNGSISRDGTVTSEMSCTGMALPLVLGIPVLVLALLAPVVMGIVLYRRAWNRVVPTAT